MYNVVLDVFCKTAGEGRIPKHSTFQSLTAFKDISASTLFSLAFLAGKDGVDMEFAGSARVSVGFMQTVIELTTKPGEVVFDWAVGEGCTFFAGDYSGRHIIVLEDRCKFGDFSREALHVVHERKVVVENVFAVPPIDEAEPLNEGPDANVEDPFNILNDVEEEPTSPPKKQDLQ